MVEPKLSAVFEKVYKRTSQLIPCDRFYAILYNPVTHELSFPLVQEKDRQEEWASHRLQEGQMPDDLFLNPHNVLYPNEEETGLFFPEGERILSWMGIPMRREGRMVGALVVERWKRESKTMSPPLPFDENNLRVLEMVAQQTTPVVENLRLHTRLERKIEALRVLNQVGQQLASGLKKNEVEIIALIHQSATELGMDTENMYIAFYEENQEKLDSFNTEVPMKSKIYGTLRFPLVYEEGKRKPYPERDVKNGLTEYVIRTRKSLNPPDVAMIYRENVQDQIGKIPISWLGVPIIKEEKVFGVIVLRNDTYRGIYTQDDLEILEILAGQTAVALQNLHLYQAWEKEQEKRLAVEKASVFGMVAAEFAHRMNNIAGTIPVRVDMARAYLDGESSRDKKITKQLNKIESETKTLLDAAQAIRKSAETRTPEVVNLREIAETAKEIARQMYKGDDSAIIITLDIPENIPLSIDRNALLETLTDIIKNALDAVDVQKGAIGFRAELRDNELRMEIKDNGCGIPLSERKKIFDLFYTTKGEEGLGFGLWRAKTFIKSLGGDIDVESEVGKRTLFTITLPSQ